MTWLRSDASGVLLNLRLAPNASRTEIAGIQGEHLRIRVQSPPVDGKANKALIKFLAGKLGIPARNIELRAGHKGREKQLLSSL